MNPGEYEVMAGIEADFWWYRGLRDLIERSVRAATPALPPKPRILDAGCGTGANLRFYSERFCPAYLGGFDIASEAVELSRINAAGADIYQSDICDPEVRVDELDLITSMDVFDIPGAKRANEGLRKLVAHLRTGGLLMLNLPAFDWLYSEHDLAVHTSERYTTRRVDALLQELGLSVELLTYRVFLLFPAVVLVRLPRMWRARSLAPEEARSDLSQGMPGDITNRLLLSCMRAENSLIVHGARFPWGSSIFAIGRKS